MPHVRHEARSGSSTCRRTSAWTRPSFAFYEGPTVKWVKRLAFEGVNAQFISTTNHIATHLDSPIHFYDPGPDIAGIPIETLVGPACVVDLAGLGVGDYQIYGPDHFERWEKKTGITIERGDILVIHTGYHRFYNEDWHKVAPVHGASWWRRTPTSPTCRAASSSTPDRRPASASGSSTAASAGWPSTASPPTIRSTPTCGGPARPHSRGRDGPRHVPRRRFPVAERLPVHAHPALPARRLPRRERRREDRRGARPAACRSAASRSASRAARRRSRGSSPSWRTAQRARATSKRCSSIGRSWVMLATITA